MENQEYRFSTYGVSLPSGSIIRDGCSNVQVGEHLETERKIINSLEGDVERTAGHMVNGQPLYTVKVRAMAPDAETRARTADEEMDFMVTNSEMTEFRIQESSRKKTAGRRVTSMVNTSQDTQSFIRKQIRK